MRISDASILWNRHGSKGTGSKGIGAYTSIPVDKVLRDLVQPSDPADLTASFVKCMFQAAVLWNEDVE
jgi:hypothetical protein